MKKIILLFLLFLVSLGIGFSLVRIYRQLSAEPTPDGLFVRPAPGGGVYILVSDQILDEIGVTVGDTVDVKLNDSLTVEAVPFHSTDFLPLEAYCLTVGPENIADEKTDEALLLRPPTGIDLWTTAGLHNPAEGSIWTKIGLRNFSRVGLSLHEKSACLYEERARTFFAEWVANADTGGFCLPSYEDRRSLHFVITSFKEISGSLTSSGELDIVSGGSHSQLIPVTPGASCYMGYRDPAVDVVGAFYNDAGDWVGPLTSADVVSYEYRSPNRLAGTWRFENESSGATRVYTLLYSFTVPENAAYVSLNCTQKPEYVYRRFVASMPVFALSNTGNMIWRDDEPIYERTRDVSLCVIGQSNVMIDRLLRETHPGDVCPMRYIAGFQEYLIPWFKTVDSYGYSGKGYMRNGSTGIYDYLIGQKVDLSGYDAFLITPGRNALNGRNMGQSDSNDPSTYCGAINALIDYIRAQQAPDKYPVIYLSNLVINPFDTDEANVKSAAALNERLREIALLKGCELLDREIEQAPQYLQYTEPRTYDGKHSNELGSRLIGEFYRKKIVGF